MYYALLDSGANLNICHYAVIDNNQELSKLKRDYNGLPRLETANGSVMEILYRLIIPITIGNFKKNFEMFVCASMRYNTVILGDPFITKSKIVVDFAQKKVHLGSDNNVYTMQNLIIPPKTKNVIQGRIFKVFCPSSENDLIINPEFKNIKNHKNKRLQMNSSICRPILSKKKDCSIVNICIINRGNKSLFVKKNTSVAKFQNFNEQAFARVNPHRENLESDTKLTYSLSKPSDSISDADLNEHYISDSLSDYKFPILNKVPVKRNKNIVNSMKGIFQGIFLIS